ncbi:putative hspc200 [Aspergillus keveii]|uniref:Hspc200 n=1 Tax=Aspergillus keveii TaxID=714993 RepID=A0ABR4GMM1_9EURO
MPVVNLKPTPIEGAKPLTAEEVEEHGTSYHQTPADIYDPIKAACVANDVTAFKKAFARFLAGNYRIQELSYAMKAAIRHDNSEIVSTLMSHGIGRYTSYAITAVQHSAKRVLLEFLKDNWNINESLFEGEPPALGYAVADEDMVIWLLAHGADPNQQSLVDYTALSVAVQNAAVSTVKLLLDHPGTDIHKGQLLHHAVFRDSDEILVLDMHLGRGLAINKKLFEDDLISFYQYFWMGCGTPLHDAANLSKLHVVHYLLARGADPTIRDAKDRTPLDWAVKYERSDVVPVLKAAMEKNGS